VLEPDELAALQQRIDAIMLGQADVDYEHLMMQLDSTTGATADAGPQSNGFKGPTLAYRKIENLELDALFREFMARPLFRSICAHVYGAEVPVSSYRAMFMNKPARQGTHLPWHQDRWQALDRDPLVTVWTALDPATVANGCVQVIDGSHREGVINPDHPSGWLTEQQAHRYCPPEKIVHLELEPGEAVLLHNWLLHASEVNGTDIARRAFSVCYMDGRTVNVSSGTAYPLLFEPPAA
ncbi:MAG TPA: phytanoyl-CoA dioxygenase family protein, partial [Mycobacteriales bacterium]|nr:phytanoyl-CoA dioxygenase family protein [Mycobacteriales bacterium]